jgi:hypothetical protein
MLARHRRLVARLEPWSSTRGTLGPDRTDGALAKIGTAARCNARTRTFA